MGEHALIHPPEGTRQFQGMVSRSVEMEEVFRLVRCLAGTPTTVLITGETGTGKELVARAVHDLSPRSAMPFVVCDCATLVPTLFESELFGHARGAFTGADRDRKGIFAAAQGGTIFLDEVGELPLDVQVKLLRVLENHETRRVGGTANRSIDVRVVAATNRDLGQLVAQRVFRADLYYRLNVGAIHVPALRRRPDDIEPLAQYFLLTFRRSLQRDVFGVETEVLNAFLRHPWPGNVRELRNVLEQMMLLTRLAHMVAGDLPPHFNSSAHFNSSLVSDLPRWPPWEFGPEGVDFYAVMRNCENRLVTRALELGGNKKAAARLLHINRTTLIEKLKRRVKRRLAAVTT